MKTKLKTGDIIFTKIPFVWYKPLRYVSWAIRKVLGTWYNHIAIYVEIKGLPYIAESTAGGVRISPADKWARDFIVEVRTPVFKVNESKLMEDILEYQGFTGYDYLSLVWYQILFQASKQKKWKGKTKEAADDKLYCSEYAALVYKEQFPKWWLITPKDLYESKDFKLVQKIIKAKKLWLKD